jgi:hypothetical protein
MEFWKSAGRHLVERDENGWLSVTPDYLRAYFTRPEIHPAETSCGAETALFEKLMADPFVHVGRAELEAIKDADAADNYRIVLKFRDHLAKHGTLEAAYAALFASGEISIPPIFIDQMVHVILCNVLSDVKDPMRLRAGELFFREQAVSVGDDQLMLADQEIVEMRGEVGFGSLSQLLADGAKPARQVALDVMTEENQQLYWERSDRFDMAVDFRFTQPAPDALGRVMEAWTRHFLQVETRIQSVQSVRDDQWSWHVGCDAVSTRILNALYRGEDVGDDDIFKLIAIYRMEFIEQADVVDTMRGKPVYLGVAMNNERRLIFKPQNLLTNLPLQRG